MYLGNIPATSFEAVKKDRFTSLTGTGVTLSHSVSNVQDIVVWVNSVKQDYNNYTVSGTALTLGGSLVSADVVQVLYVGRTFQSVNPSADSVTASQIADNAISEEHLDPTIITGLTAEATIATDDTILIHDTSASALRKMTRANFVSGIGGDNTPAWKATNSSSSQSISHDSTTKLTFTEEVFDTDSAYDATNSKFVVPSGEGGKYLISMKYEMEVLTNPTYAYIYVNGSVTSATRFKASSYSNEARMIVTLSAGDYVEGYTYQASGGSVNVLGLSGARGSVFEGFKLIGV